MRRPHEVLEEKWAAWNQLPREGMVVCSSGTAALHLALETLKSPRWARCAVPDFTMVACARASTLANLEPVFVDCDDNLLMCPDTLDNLARMQQHAPDVLIAAHIYGRQCNMAEIAQIADTHDMKVVEDLAEAHGMAPHCMTDAACWSFYQNKVIGGEEGGAVWFKDPYRAAAARQLRNLGFTAAHDFTHVPRGHNYRLADCLATKVLDSIEMYARNLIVRDQICAWYDEACPAELKMPPRTVPWVYDFRLPWTKEGYQDRVVAGLHKAGYEARHGFKRMTCQQEYRVPGLGFTKAAHASSHIVYLPLTPTVTTTAWECKTAFDVVMGVLTAR